MKVKKILKWYLLITSIYLVSDGLMHVFNIKLLTAAFWDEAPLTYSKYISNLFGMFAILAGCFGVEASRNLEKYRNFLYITALWGLVYAGYLIYYSLFVDFINIFRDSPSVFAWMPFYNAYLIFEAGLLIILVTLIYLFRKNINDSE